MVILNQRHRKEVVCVLKREGGYAWSEERLCMQQIMHQDGKAINQPEEIKLCEKPNTTEAIVGMDKLVVNTMKNIISYADAFQLQYGCKIMQSRIK